MGAEPKYRKFRAKLERYQEEESYQAKINEYKKDYLGLVFQDQEQLIHANVKAIAKDFVAADKRKDAIEAKLSDVNLELAALGQILRDILEGREVEKEELKSGAKLRLQDTPYPSVENRSDMMNWVHEEHLENLLSLHHGTLKTICNERLLAGQAPPPGVKVWMKTQIRVDYPRGGKPKKEEE